MKGFVLLTGEAPDLALAEVNGALKALSSSEKAERVEGQIAVMNGAPPPGLAKRLGFSHFTGILDEVRSLELEDIIKGAKASLEKVQKPVSVSFRVKVPKGKAPFSSSNLFETMDRIAREKGYAVRHRDPDQKLFVIVGEKAYIGRITMITERLSTNSRRGSKMPYNRPIVMDPRLARVLVNLSGLPPKSMIVDPFLGPAGLAVEAAHLGIKVLGIEKEAEIYHGARVNVEHLGLSDMIEIRSGDSRKLRDLPWMKGYEGFDGIITDPPFGRSATTGGADPGKLLNEVLSEVSSLLDKGAPLVLNSHSPDLIEDISGFELMERYSFRVHRSMTRHIAVLKKQ
jgi:tRNA (guanine10-N2)-dimethyltransferase